MPKMGRKTNGGREMMSKPLSVDVIRAGVAVRLGVCSGDVVGRGESLGEAVGDGEAVAESRAKFAHGLGGTLAQTLCTPGASPLKGLMRVLKLPLASAVAEPATLFG